MTDTTPMNDEVMKVIYDPITGTVLELRHDTVVVDTNDLCVEALYEGDSETTQVALEVGTRISHLLLSGIVLSDLLHLTTPMKKEKD